MFEGTSRDALLHAIEANRQHGLPLTSSDKRKAIGTLLTQHAQWSDRRIAAFVGVSHCTVAAVRIDMKPERRIGQIVQ